MSDQNKEAKPKDEAEQIQGRSIFIVETVAGGIKVQTGFLAEDGRVMPLPALFPTQEYALSQIDELRKVVIQHFAQAAAIGSQVIAQHSQKQESDKTNPIGPGPEDTIQ